jgi:8-oxo-dGTP diphosphatase
MNVRTVAKVILADSSDNILLLKRSESDERRPLEWDIPGGHVDAGEFTEEAAVRETQEEAGIIINSRQLMLATTITEQVKEDLCVSWLFYIARTDNSEVTLSYEHIEHRWVSLAEAINMLEYERQKNALMFIEQKGLLDGRYA